MLFLLDKIDNNHACRTIRQNVKMDIIQHSDSFHLKQKYTYSRMQQKLSKLRH